jgi:hypothetical protein
MSAIPCLSYCPTVGRMGQFAADPGPRQDLAIRAEGKDCDHTGAGAQLLERSWQAAASALRRSGVPRAPELPLTGWSSRCSPRAAAAVRPQDHRSASHRRPSTGRRRHPGPGRTTMYPWISSPVATMTGSRSPQPAIAASRRRSRAGERSGALPQTADSARHGLVAAGQQRLVVPQRSAKQ